MSPVSSYDGDFEYGLPTHIPWNSSDDNDDDDDDHVSSPMPLHS